MLAVIVKMRQIHKNHFLILIKYLIQKVENFTISFLNIDNQTTNKLPNWTIANCKSCEEHRKFHESSKFSKLQNWLNLMILSFLVF